jgi:endonuclease-3
MKGSYLLFIKLVDNEIIKYGVKNKNYFNKGFYIYVGSALNNLENRIERHLRDNKKTYWHIDYLLNFCEIIKVYYRENNYREECNIANSLNKNFLPINEFGSSDCKCKSHLFYGSKEKILDFIEKNNFKKYQTKDLNLNVY